MCGVINICPKIIQIPIDRLKTQRTSKKDVTLYEERVNWIFGCGLQITECTQLFGFLGGGNDKDLDM